MRRILVIFGLAVLIGFSPIIGVAGDKAYSQPDYLQVSSLVEDQDVIKEVIISKSVDDYLNSWHDKFNTDFSIDPTYSADSNFVWQVKPVAWHKVNIAYYEMVDRELLKYPKSFFTDIGVSHIYFVDSIRMNGNIAVLGFSDVKSGRIMFNVEASRASTELIQSTIHHEISHVALYSYYGNMMFGLSSWPTARVEAETKSVGSFPQKGYVSNYATTSVAEDMAEVYAYLMTDGLNNQLSSHLVTDKIVSRKVNIIKQAIDTSTSNFTWPI